MEEIQKIGQNGLQKKHFAKIHERIQQKYEEMQRKIEISRSMESLTTASYNSIIKGINTQQIYDSDKNSDISDVVEPKSDTNKGLNVVKHYHIEHVQEENAEIFQRRSTFCESIFSDSTTDLTIVEDNTSEDDNTIIANNNDYIQIQELNTEKSQTHLFLANENEKEAKIDEEPNVSPQPSPRLLRDKIKFNFFKNRERRKRNSKSESVIPINKKKQFRENIEKVIFSDSLKQDNIKNHKKSKIATVTIALIEATGLENDFLEEKPRLLHCRFRFSSEKFKSKTVKCNGPSVQWQEIFNFSMYEEDVVEIGLWDKDVLIGKCAINLLYLEKEKTHRIRVNLEDDMSHIQIFVLLTISGSQLENTVVDLDDYQKEQERIEIMRKKLAWFRLKNEDSTVGYLSVIVYGAKGLSGQDCYCVLELGNDRLQTHTDFKTNNPNWMKAFSFKVTDIATILEVSVHDERKNEIVGKLSIPLLKISSVEKKWYALKDFAQKERAKGNNSRILLELTLTWNLIKSSLRVLKPKEPKYLQTNVKLDRQVFSRNLTRAKAVNTWVLNFVQLVKTCFAWDDWRWNVTALVLWISLCWSFKPWMLPLFFILPFMWYKPSKFTLLNWKKYLGQEPEEGEEKEEIKSVSIRQKIHSIQEMIQSVQNAIGVYASLAERVKNLFNFTTPYLSCLAVFLCVMISFIMYLIPVRLILTIWALHKFIRKIIQPNRISNNEILDLLSRVPDDDILIECEEIPLENSNEDDG